MTGRTDGRGGNGADDREDDLATLARHLAEMRRELERTRADLAHERNLLRLTEDEVRALKRSWSYRVGRIVVSPASGAKLALKAIKGWRAGRGFAERRWSPEGELPDEETSRLLVQYRRLRRRPKFSILTPVYNTPPGVLRDTIDSVFRQIYENWELILADDASTDPRTAEILEEYRKRDPERVKVLRLAGNSGVAMATNKAAEAATGDFLALLDHDDILTPDALLETALRAEAEPEAELIYSDEDKIDESGKLVQAFHKPDFAPEYLLCNNYICHFCAFRKDLFERCGGFRPGFDGSQDFELFLRLTRAAARVEHVPKILYHWRMVPGSTSADPNAKGGPWRETSRKALEETVKERGWDAEVGNGLVPGTYRVRFAVKGDPRVCIVIPTKDRLDLLRRCVASVRRRTEGANWEILVVSNNSTNDATFKYLDEQTAAGRFRWIAHDEPFNFSRINNVAVAATDAPHLVFMNNDMEVLSGDWLTSMLEYAQQPEIGAVGAKLLYPNDTVQHAGIVLGMMGVAGHVFKHAKAGQHGYFGWIDMVRDVGAVTAACMAMRREVFEEIGGFDERIAVAFNDVDLCIRTLQTGRRIVYTPYAQLYHHESASRGDDESPEHYMRFRSEIAYMVSKWGQDLYRDPGYNRNLSIWHPDCRARGADEDERMERFVEEFSNWDADRDPELKRRARAAARAR